MATRHGCLYLAVAMEAMTIALRYGQPGGGLLHHSDRRPQYTSDDFRDLLDQHSVLGGICAHGHCYDNTPVESFFALLKREQDRRGIYTTCADAKADLFNDIEVFYNRKRRHPTLEYLSPVQFENRTMGP